MSEHKPVLLREAIEMLDLKEGMTVVDATLGGGGYARSILEKIGKDGKLIAIDLDKDAIENFEKSKNVILVNDNFSNLGRILESLNIEKVDAIVADLGWSSDQLQGKGMSFLKDEKLDMRLSLRNTNLYETTNEKLNAEYIVNNYEEKELGRVIREYGEERFWKNIAREIIKERKKKKIETTKDLVEIIQKAVPEKYKHGKNPRKNQSWTGQRGKHFATRTFQALRIEVNQELENLKRFLPEAIENLNKGGKLAVVSFHSLEDRIVKQLFRENARGCICPPAMQLQKLQEKLLSEPENKIARINLEKALRAGPPDFPQCVCGKSPVVLIITKKPIMPDQKEIEDNPRARSAKLRVCERR